MQFSAASSFTWLIFVMEIVRVVYMKQITNFNVTFRERAKFTPFFAFFKKHS
jgi:hypothetical protein